MAAVDPAAVAAGLPGIDGVNACEGRRSFLKKCWLRAGFKLVMTTHRLRLMAVKLRVHVLCLYMTAKAYNTKVMIDHRLTEKFPP